MIPASLAADLFNRTLECDRGWFLMANHQLRACEILFDAWWHAKRRFDVSVEGGQVDFTSPSDIQLGYTTMLYPQISLLAGLAMENFLKGIWVLKNPLDLNVIDQLPKVLKTHDVLFLAETVGLSLTKEEKLCLKHLSQMSKWQGKYQIPLSQRENVQTHREGVTPTFMLSKYDRNSESPAFPDEFALLVQKIDQMAELLRKQRQPECERDRLDD